MPKFSRTSAERLGTCCPELQAVFNFLIRFVDCTIIEGHRGKRDQNYYHSQGKSRVRFPAGKHNSHPSTAVDVAPYGDGEVLWDKNNCIYFAGMVVLVGIFFGYKIRWGGNWDSDNELLTDQEFQDLVHFEYIGRL